MESLNLSWFTTAEWRRENFSPQVILELNRKDKEKTSKNIFQSRNFAKVVTKSLVWVYKGYGKFHFKIRVKISIIMVGIGLKQELRITNEILTNKEIHFPLVIWGSTYLRNFKVVDIMLV